MPEIKYKLTIFQSTPPGWEATQPALDAIMDAYNFNPRLPGGRRPSAALSKFAEVAFQSTPPGWEATDSRFARRVRGSCISIHASRVGGDVDRVIVLIRIRGEISIHASRVGGDMPTKEQLWDIDISIHASRVGGDVGGE